MVYSPWVYQFWKFVLDEQAKKKERKAIAREVADELERRQTAKGAEPWCMHGRTSGPCEKCDEISEIVRKAHLNGEVQS